MDAYMYLSGNLVDELMEGENEALKLFLKGVLSWLDSMPLHTEVPENEKEAMEMEEILDAMTIKNVGTITVGKDIFDGKTVTCESFVDTKTGDTKKYYFDGDKLIGVDTIYKNEKLGTDRIVVHEITNSASKSFFNQPWPNIKMPEGMM
jgi:hypothetical protein